MAVSPAAAAIRLAEMAAKANMTVERFLEKFGSIQYFPMGSTAIREAWYQPITNTLWINFNKVKSYPKYRFDDVPGDVMAGFANARSKGAYYHQNIKGNYYSASIRGPEDESSDIRTQYEQLAR